MIKQTIKCRTTLALALLFSSMLVYAADMSGVIKAQIILGQVQQVMDKYEDIQALISNGQAQLEVADPREDTEGKFIFPYMNSGLIADWADKAINAQVGAQVGAMAGDKATGALASKVPFGGLAGGLLKGKGKELAAVTAIGGWEFIKETSDLSFDTLDDYSLYMHTEFEGGADYEKALAAAMAIYPDLEKTHKRSIDNAYKKARKSVKN